MKCPNCQFNNNEDALFCSKCGNKLEFVCPKCGKEITPDSNFCNKCGHDLTKPTETTPVDYDQPQSYTPKFLADKILTTRSSIEGERKLVTVLFADVADYTSLSEKLDPEEVHQIMDGCFKILMDEIHTYEGTINQFTGDGVMALFGAPLAHEDHAQRACHAALAIQDVMTDYGYEIRKKYGMDFQMRMGLNSGPVIVGAIGDDMRMDYTAVGDTTNLAARMESMAGPGAILVSGDTYRLVRDFFEFESREKVEVKGKEEPQETFKLIKTGEVETRIGASVSKGLTGFVGRKNSMAALKEPFEKVQSGSGQVVGIVGEAGVGKSRLLLEFKNRFPQSEFTYLEGRCLQYGGSIIYMPILDILRSYFDIREGDREFVVKKKVVEKIFGLDEKFSELSLPVFQELFSLKVDDENFSNMEPQKKRERTFEAIRDMLVRVSQERPLVLAVEDLHWIDKTSEEFLDYLMGWLPNTSIMLILLYRPEYNHQWGSKSYYTKIGLDQLGASSSAELVQAMLEDGEIAPELRELILQRAAGNPLFMEEFTHTLLENGSIEKKDKKYVLSRQASDIQVPDTIQGIIASRMDRLEDNLKRTMQVASVIGRDFAFRILQTITGMAEELKSYLLNLQGLEFIYEKNLFPELEYIFKHALTQEVAYNSLLLTRRKEIHEKIGMAIEDIYAARLEEFYEMLAYHYSASENLEKAHRYLKLSGDKATRNHSLWEAFRFYKEAINALSRMPETEPNRKENIEVHLLISIPMHLLGYPEDSLQILQEGEGLSQELGDERNLAIFLSKIGGYYAYWGETLLSVKYTENSFQKAEKIQDIELIAPIAFELCFSYNRIGEYSKTVDTVPKILDRLESTHRECDFFGTRINVYSGLSAYCGLAYAYLGNFEKGIDLFERGLHFALQVDHPYSVGIVEFFYGMLFYTMGDGKNCIHHVQKSIRYLEEAQAVFLLGIAWSLLGTGYNLLGEFETARNHVEKGLKIDKDIGSPFALSLHYSYLSLIHFELGDLDNAQSSAEKGLELAQKHNQRNAECRLKMVLGRIIWKRETSRVANAEEHILQGIRISEELKMKPAYAIGYLYLGELYADAGQKEKSLENLKKAEENFREMGMDYWLAKTQEVLNRL